MFFYEFLIMIIYMCVTNIIKKIIFYNNTKNIIFLKVNLFNGAFHPLKNEWHDNWQLHLYSVWFVNVTRTRQTGGKERNKKWNSCPSLHYNTTFYLKYKLSKIPNYNILSNKKYLRQKIIQYHKMLSCVVLSCVVLFYLMLLCSVLTL